MTLNVTSNFQFTCFCILCLLISAFCILEEISSTKFQLDIVHTVCADLFPVYD